MSRDKIQFVGPVRERQLPPRIREDIGRALAMFNGKSVRITIEEAKRIRTNKQNAYYWGVVIPIVHEFFSEHGNNVDKDEVHDFLKTHVGKNKKVIVTPDGVNMSIPGTTTKLSTQDFEIYMEKVRAWAAGFALMIPLPNEDIYAD